MRSAQDFLQACNQLMSGQPPRVILERTLRLLNDPCRWTHKARAIDARGWPVKPESPYAESWSVEGAISIMCNNWGILPPYFMLLLDDVAGEYGESSVNVLEGFATHETMLELLQKAVQRVP